MRNYCQPNTGRPSRASIAGTVGVGMLMSMATFSILVAPGFDNGHLTGVMLGVIAVVEIGFRGVRQVIRRHETGMWIDPEGHPLLVRIDDWPPGSLIELGQVLGTLERRGWRPVESQATEDIRRWIGAAQRVSFTPSSTGSFDSQLSTFHSEQRAEQ